MSACSRSVPYPVSEIGQGASKLCLGKEVSEKNMMVKIPRKPNKQERKQLIVVMVKEDDGFNTREAIEADYANACIAVFDRDQERPEDDNKTMVVVWPRNLEMTQAFFWVHGKLYREQINP